MKSIRCTVIENSDIDFLSVKYVHLIAIVLQKYPEQD